MLIWAIIILISIQLTLSSLASSLKYLNLSQLKKMFDVNDYTSLVNQLKNRDEIEILSWFFATLFTIASVSILSINLQHGIEFLVAIGICFALFLNIIPILVVKPWAERFLIELMPLYRLIESIPFAVTMVSFFHRMSYRLAGEAEEETLSMEMSHLIMEGEADGTVGSAEKVMIQRVIDLKHTAVREVMTPRAKVIFTAEGSPVKDAMGLASEHGLSRLPIYDSEKDQIKGVFFVRDVLEKVSKGESIDELTVDKVMRQVPVVPETRSIGSLLKTMSKSRNQMLIVLDEYGIMSGVITLEDILEEIVGEIRDEYADEDTLFRELDSGIWETQGGTNVYDLNEQLHLNIPENDAYETIAGFLLNKAQRIPRRGEIFKHDGFKYVILQATPKKIERLRIEKEN